MEPDPAGLPAYPNRIGEPPADFGELTGTDGKPYMLSSFRDKRILVVIFMSNRCPTARIYKGRLLAVQADYGPRGVQLVAVNSDNKYLFPTEDLPDMAKTAQERGFTFPYLKDERQLAARAFGAAVTLHAFVLDEQRKVRYRGRIDDSRNPALITASDLRNALDDLLAGREVAVPETRPFACQLEYV